MMRACLIFCAFLLSCAAAQAQQTPKCLIKECQFDMYYGIGPVDTIAEILKGVDVVVDCWNSHMKQQPDVYIYTYYTDSVPSCTIFSLATELSHSLVRRGINDRQIRYRFIPVTVDSFMEFGMYSNRVIVGCILDAE